LSWIICSVLTLLGFVDDYAKLKKIKGVKTGLTPSMKISIQLILAILVSAYLYLLPPNNMFVTKVNVPYLKNAFLDLGVIYILFSIMVLVGSSNAVNLTDGLDGLAVGSWISAAVTFAIFCYLAGHVKLSSYLRIIPVSGAGECSVFLAAGVGACLVFLWYNCHPAQIFMGDTGSLFLGGVLGSVALFSKQEIILVIVGGLFVIEAVSVLMQVYAFRIHGKRVFKMAPIHHHFELSGWPESKVVVRFWIISIILSLLALSSLKVR
jgi:phospho-N-acetylmuramoyl-pentapeptide-transferase